MNPSVDSIAGQLVDGRYRLEHGIGRGGMGVVYRATDVFEGRSVAVKVLHPTAQRRDMLYRRFEREAQAMRELGVAAAKVYAVGRHEGAPYVAMELLDGIDLDAYSSGQPLPVQEVIEIARQVARALAAAHSLGLVHRDLKPANVFLERTGEGLRARLLDFGLVKLRGHDAEPLTVTGSMIGTLPYMAPEQVRDSACVDQQADVWSFGITLYQLLTGELPYQDHNPARLMQKIFCAEPVPPSSWCSTIPAELDELVMACLRRDPSERPASMRDIASALDALPEVDEDEPLNRRSYDCCAFVETQVPSSMAA